ncbi:hypothetical protein GCM10011282_25360 [Undibacterium macrobrachii]|jgi:hypothetical protein|uniref:Uncharacterized protein n=1 Tax=Undibacterium macrobrachii TaxID=1119058 RepID=A0ABQ2XIV5_9BURK|nr:hypothetical protein GCM10011282_25360 [Undibacterium macrobrachii]
MQASIANSLAYLLAAKYIEKSKVAHYTLMRDFCFGLIGLTDKAVIDERIGVIGITEI